MIQGTHQFRWQAWLLWSGVFLLVIGFITEQSWQSLPLPRTLETLVLGSIALALAALLGRFLRCSLATGLAGLFFLALAWFVGILPIAATLLLMAGGFCLGRAITGSTQTPSATIAGIGLLAGTSGWLLPFPLHYRLVYFLLLMLLCVIQRRHLLSTLRDGIASWHAAVADSPAIAAFAALVVGLASAGCWLPTVQYDDLAYHLGLPSQLATLGYYRMDVHSQIWALAPWSGDIVQAMAQLLAGQEARGAVDAFWLLAAATLTWQLAAALDAPMFARWLSVALLASLPLTASLAGGMQAELPAAAVSLALALTVASAAQSATLRHCLLVAALAGFLLGLKTGFVAITLPLCFWLIWRWRGQWSWRNAIASVGLTSAVCGSSYFYAWILTGNPLFPLLNGYFRSPFFELRNLSDPRWTAPVGWDLPWQLTFHTHAYMECWDGAGGYCLLGLLGAIVIALASSKLRPLAAVALLAFMLAIGTVHYFRYGYPALVLMIPVMITAVALAASRRNATILLMALIVLDLAYQSCSFWTLHTGGIKHVVLHAQSDSPLQRFAPERVLVQLVHERDPDANVIFCTTDHPFAAELAGRGFVTAYYDPELEYDHDAAETDSSGTGWRALFARTGARYAIVSDLDLSPALHAALADTRLVRQIGSAQLRELPAIGTNPDGLMHERDFAMKFRP